MRLAILTSVVILAIARAAMAQTVPSAAADGPWSGQVQCVLTAKGENYQDEQTHTWRITGGPPVMNGVFRQWPAVWSVQGSGSRRVGGTGGAAASGQSESWTINVAETRAPIAMWEVSAGRLRIGSQHGILVANGSIAGRTITPGVERPFTASVDEWEFPVVEDVASNTTISGTRTRTIPGRRSGWRQPAEVATTETCTWNYTRGGASAPGTISGGRRADQIEARANGVVPPTVAGAIAASSAGAGSTPAPIDTRRTELPTDTRARIGLPTVPTPSSDTATIAPITPTVPSAKTVQPAPLPSASTPPNTVALLSDTYVRCQIDVDGGQSYNDHQTHTWAIRGGATPTSAGVYDATWSVSGRGFRTYTTNQYPPVPPIASTDNWTYTAAGFSAPIAIVMGASGGATITLAHGPMTAQSGAAGTETYQYTSPPGWCPAATAACLKAKDPANFSWPVGEFQFGRIDVPGTPAATGPSRLVVGSTSVAVSGPVLKDVQPAAAKVTASCSWNVPPPSAPSTSSAPTSTPPTTASLPGGSLPAGTSITKGPAEGATIVGNSPVVCSTNGATATTTATPGSVTLKWPAVSGAKYSVSRKDLGVLTPTPLTDSTYTHIAPLDYRSTPYQYSITTTFQDNRCATTNISVTPPKPIVPNVSATVSEVNMSGRVSLAWGVQSDSPTSYLVLGPGLNQDGVEVTAAAAGQSLNIDKLQAGTYEWRVTPLWKTSAGTMSDVTNAARVSATVVITSGKYRISIAGFRVNYPTYDNQLSLDGRGDEVYAAATVTQWQRALNQILVSNTTVKSDVYGDANQSTRVQAGRASPQGGLTAGDVAPSGWDPSRAPSGAPSTTRFPLLLWEGALRNFTDVVVVHPSLWEADGDPTTFEHWKGNTSGGAASNYFWFKDMSSSAIFEHKNDYPTDIYQFSTAAQWSGPDDAFASTTTYPQRIYPGRDRPIGMDMYSEDVSIGIYNYSKIYWVDREYTFTREKIEALLSANPNGIVAVPFVDGDPHHEAGKLLGNYTLYFHVQRVP